MCGICFYVECCKPLRHEFKFDPFQSYIDNPYFKDQSNTKEQYFSCTQGKNYFQYLISEKLLLKEIPLDGIAQMIYKRGPDFISKVDTDVQFCQGFQCKPQKIFQIQMIHTLLHLRGNEKELITQPIIDRETGNTLLFNGQIYGVKNVQQCCEFENFQFDDQQNDTLQIFEIFNEFSQNFSKSSSKIESSKLEREYEQKFRLIANCLDGDYAIVFFDKINSQISVLQDFFGKRSLLMAFTENGFVFTSAVPPNFQSLRGKSAFSKQEMDSTNEEQGPEVKQPMEQGSSETSQQERNLQYIEKKYLNEYLSSINKQFLQVPAGNVIYIHFTSLKDEENSKGKVLFQWNSLRISNKILSIKEQTVDFPIELVSKAHSIPAIFLQKTQDYLMKSIYQLVQNIIQYQKYFTNEHKEHYQEILQTPKELKDIEQIKDEESSRQIDQIKENEESQDFTKTQSHIAILFSGGLDSSLIVLLLDQILPNEEEIKYQILKHRIDLINLTFSLDAPDRKTAIEALEELTRINPQRKFNLILIDQTLTEALAIQEQLLTTIYPQNSHMDFNIAMVLQLATVLKGYLFNINPEIKIPVESMAQVILSGLGADEVFGGYSRYRMAFLRKGFTSLQQEMNYDLTRLWVRNLGRDDRAISSNGRQCRFPFLDEDLIDYVNNGIPFEYLTDFSMPRGTGDKILLREVAQKNNLIKTSAFKKRAIQFGTKLAKQSNIQKFGSNRKAKGTVEYQFKGQQ